MTARRGMTAQGKGRDPGAVGDVLDPDRTDNRPATFARDRQVEQHSPVPGQKVALPGEPHDRVAAAHQKPIPGMRQAARVVRGRSVVEELQHPLIAAVAVVEKNAPVAAPGIDRFQDREIAGKADEPVGIGWSLVEVGDPLLCRDAWIDRKLRAPDQHFICPDRAELVPRCERETFGDRQFCATGHIQLGSNLWSWTGVSRP